MTARCVCMYCRHGRELRYRPAGEIADATDVAPFCVDGIRGTNCPEGSHHIGCEYADQNDSWWWWVQLDEAMGELTPAERTEVLQGKRPVDTHG